MGVIGQNVRNYIRDAEHVPSFQMARLMIDTALASEDESELAEVINALLCNGWKRGDMPPSKIWSYPNLNHVLKEAREAIGVDHTDLISPVIELSADPLIAQAEAESIEAQEGVTEEKVEEMLDALVKTGERPSKLDVREIIEAVALLDDPATEEDVVEGLSGLNWKKATLNSQLKKARGKFKAADEDVLTDAINEAKLKLTGRYKYVTSADGFYDMYQNKIFGVNNVYHAVRDDLPRTDEGGVIPPPIIMLENPESKFDDVAYRPGCEDLIIEEGHLRLLNVYRPSELEPVEGDVSLIIELIDGWFGDDKMERDYVLDTIAHQIQFPHMKQPHALVLQSDQGYGKGSLFTCIIQPIVGAHNYVEPGNEELARGDFSFLEEKLISVVNETMVGDRRELSSALKQSITEPEIRVIKKYLNTYRIENIALQIYCSNHDNPLFIEPSDRRFFVYKIRSAKPSKAFFAALHRWIKEEDGAAKFYSWLLARDLSKYGPYDDPPMTDAKADTINQLRSEAYNLLAKMLEEEEGPFARPIWNIEALLQRLKERIDKTRITRGTLIKVIEENGGGKISQHQVRIPILDEEGNELIGDDAGEQKIRPWATRDLEHWKGVEPLELAREYHNMKVEGEEALVEDDG